MNKSHIYQKHKECSPKWRKKMHNIYYTKIQTTSTASNFFYPLYYKIYTSTSATTTVVQIWNECEWYPFTLALNDTWAPLQVQQQPIQPIRRNPAQVRRQKQEIAQIEKRARETLLGELTPWQRNQFEQHGYFLYVGQHGRYRIRRGIAANIDVLDHTGGVCHRLCIHPLDLTLPPEDVMLAQLLHLQDDEDKFLKIANKHPPLGTSEAVDRHLVRAEWEAEQERILLAA